MDGKNSFILYCDIGQHLELLSDEDAGLLFKGIVHYADTGEPPQLPPMAAMAFSFIRAQIDRDDDIGKIYLSSKTTDDSTDEKAQTFSATYGPAGVTNYLYLQYLERAYHTAEANRKIAAGEGGNPDGSFNKSDLVNALNYMNLTNEERRAYFSIVAPTWKNPY